MRCEILKGKNLNAAHDGIIFIQLILIRTWIPVKLMRFIQAFTRLRYLQRHHFVYNERREEINPILCLLESLLSEEWKIIFVCLQLCAPAACSGELRDDCNLKGFVFAWPLERMSKGGRKDKKAVNECKLNLNGSIPIGSRLSEAVAFESRSTFDEQKNSEQITSRIHSNPYASLPLLPLNDL